MTDPVNHPKHYNSHPSGVEAIELCRLLPFSIGNAVKYLMRAGLKETSTKKQDLLKAAWYLNDQASSPDFCISGKAMRIAKKILEAEPYGTALYCIMALLANLSWDAEELIKLSEQVESAAKHLAEDKKGEKKPGSYDLWCVSVKNHDGSSAWLADFCVSIAGPSVSIHPSSAIAFPTKGQARFFAFSMREDMKSGRLGVAEVKVIRKRLRKKR